MSGKWSSSMGPGVLPDRKLLIKKRTVSTLFVPACAVRWILRINERSVELVSGSWSAASAQAGASFPLRETILVLVTTGAALAPRPSAELPSAAPVARR